MEAKGERVCCHNVSQIRKDNTVTSQEMFANAQVRNSRVSCRMVNYLKSEHRIERVKKTVMLIITIAVEALFKKPLLCARQCVRHFMYVIA